MEVNNDRGKKMKKTYNLNALVGDFQSGQLRHVGIAEMQEHGGIIKLDAITLLGIVHHAIIEGRTSVLVRLKETENDA